MANFNDDVFPPEEVGHTTNDEEWREIGVKGDAWDFDANKTLQGVLVEKRTNVGPNNSEMYMVETPDHEVHGVWSNTVLKDKFSSIMIGEEVKIVYQGLVKSPKTGREFKSFKIYHK